MKLLANPVLVRMVLLLLSAAAMLILGVWIMRRLRKEIVAEVSSPTPRADNAPAFAVTTFQSVIRQLKDKEEELQRLRQAAQDRATTAENVAAAVLTNLETGVVVFNGAGLARQANPAAREILGYATVSGMHARDLFRGIGDLHSPDGKAPGAIAEAMERALRDASVFRALKAQYVTPAGERRNLVITIAPALGPTGECYGAVCLVSDRGTAATG